MGGASRTSTFSNRRSAGFPIGDKGEKPFWEDVADEMAEQMVRQRKNHSAHVAGFRKEQERIRKHQEWVNRPWTWKNRLAAVINWVLGD